MPPAWSWLFGADGVRIRFHEPIDPGETAVAQGFVRCHLHDPEALATAERGRARERA